MAMTEERRLNDKIRDGFNRENVQVNLKLRRIEVYWMHDIRGKIWVPYGGGPLYNDQAKDQARWLKAHLEEFRSLLPKKIRDWPIVMGELQTRTFPGIFTEKIDWTLVEKTQNYHYWKRPDASGKFFYTCTSISDDKLPPLDNGGYYDLDTLKMLKNDK
jgi:hypothetical protein